MWMLLVHAVQHVHVLLLRVLLLLAHCSSRGRSGRACYWVPPLLLLLLLLRTTTAAAAAAAAAAASIAAIAAATAAHHMHAGLHQVLWGMLQHDGLQQRLREPS
jgi:hypothetical protein